MNLVFSIVALTIAIVACVSCFWPFFFQPAPLRFSSNQGKNQELYHRRESNPFELEKLPISESSVKFIVEKIEEKIVKAQQ